MNFPANRPLTRPKFTARLKVNPFQRCFHQNTSTIMMQAHPYEGGDGGEPDNPTRHPTPTTKFQNHNFVTSSRNAVRAVFKLSKLAIENSNLLLSTGRRTLWLCRWRQSTNHKSQIITFENYIHSHFHRHNHKSQISTRCSDIHLYLSHLDIDASNLYRICFLSSSYLFSCN